MRWMEIVDWNWRNKRGYHRSAFLNYILDGERNNRNMTYCNINYMFVATVFRVGRFWIEGQQTLWFRHGLDIFWIHHGPYDECDSILCSNNNNNNKNNNACSLYFHWISKIVGSSGIMGYIKSVDNEKKNVCVKPCIIESRKYLIFLFIESC